ncbi:hypothetical protein FQZ97_966990 [compost metagenome]
MFVVRTLGVAVTGPGPEFVVEITHHQVEATVRGRIEVVQQRLPAQPAVQPAGGQFTPAALARPGLDAAHIGEHGHAAGFADPQPGAAVPQVAPGHHAGAFGQGPAVQGSGRPVQKFVAVGRDQQRTGRAGIDGKGDQAHGMRRRKRLRG